MLDGFGAVLDRLQGLLGKGYLLAGFFPALLAALASLPLIQIVSPEFPYYVQDALELPAGRQAALGLITVLLVAFAGLLLYITNSWFRRLFESGMLPPLAAWFQWWQQRRLQDLQKKIQDMRPDVVDYRCEVRDGKWNKQLLAARVRGRSQNGAGPATRDMLAGIEAMGTLRSANERIPFADEQRTFQLLIADLERHNADTIPELNRAQVSFEELSLYAYEQTEVAFGRLNSERHTQFPNQAGRVGPSALSNLNAAHEDAIFERYGMNGELFWPLVEKYASADEHFRGSLEESKVRLDFPVSMAAVALLFTVGWLAALLALHAGRVPACLLAILGPAAALIFYRIAVWNAYAFNATVRTAIELFRFQVLAGLHCALPADSAEERQVWRALTRLRELGEGAVPYRHV